jgi:hypothetical protein
MAITSRGPQMSFMFLGRESDAPIKPDEVRGEHKKALADFAEARQATLTVNLAGMDGMSAAHEVVMRFEAARANCTAWAHRVASL